MSCSGHGIRRLTCNESMFPLSMCIMQFNLVLAKWVVILCQWESNLTLGGSNVWIVTNIFFKPLAWTSGSSPASALDN